MRPEKLIATTADGLKMFDTGKTITLGHYVDILIMVQGPDGTFLTPEPISLQHYLKSSQEEWIWRRR